MIIFPFRHIKTCVCQFNECINFNNNNAYGLDSRQTLENNQKNSVSQPLTVCEFGIILLCGIKMKIQYVTQRERSKAHSRCASDTFVRLAFVSFNEPWKKTVPNLLYWVCTIVWQRMNIATFESHKKAKTFYADSDFFFSRFSFSLLLFLLLLLQSCPVTISRNQHSKCGSEWERERDAWMTTGNFGLKSCVSVFSFRVHRWLLQCLRARST